jgi:L-threonylcarbamoyladenylate synthase
VRVFHFGDPVAPLRDLLARGGVVAFPTESSYALGVDPWNQTGVEAIYRIKEREAGKALPVVIAGRAQLAGLGIDENLRFFKGDPNIVERFFAVWPAPLTVVLPVARPLPASAGEGTLAVRVPAHAELLALLAALGHGLTATSANRSGEAPILDPAALGALLAGEDAAVVDGGVLPGGLPSTLVALSAEGAIEGEGLVVLREGRFPAERLTRDLGRSTARGEAPPARPTGEDEA